MEPDEPAEPASGAERMLVEPGLPPGQIPDSGTTSISQETDELSAINSLNSAPRPGGPGGAGAGKDGSARKHPLLHKDDAAMVSELAQKFNALKKVPKNMKRQKMEVSIGRNVVAADTVFAEPNLQLVTWVNCGYGKDHKMDWVSHCCASFASPPGAEPSPHCVISSTPSCCETSPGTAQRRRWTQLTWKLQRSRAHRMCY
jgi:hypothetical protein